MWGQESRDGVQVLSGEGFVVSGQTEMKSMDTRDADVSTWEARRGLDREVVLLAARKKEYDAACLQDLRILDTLRPHCADSFLYSIVGSRNDNKFPFVNDLP
ncbi:hypothetical protein PHSY_005751 [Pseudozyma hubeiensis SY62]|uniref:Uncharacterized protein n=1 Tax=Pseudozyma hubeiensis (strain SY62) TaxID=1305764 RepID=R9PA78_PSEHS|nr:hypothetical protein PHSY_005751 [Pseudozyma hubeiensis SY62]GAC98162.1 hypothetical protein PHSY_005751 [Pseudozyma hubeiensis SY62]